MYSQKSTRTANIENLIVQYCPICKNDPEKRKVVSSLSNAELKKDTLATYYHNYHILSIGKNTFELEQLADLENELKVRLTNTSSEMTGCFYFLRGRIFLKKDILSEALSSFNNAISLSADPILMSNIYINIAYIHEVKKEFKKALISLERAESLVQEHPNPYYLKEIYKNKALCYLHLKNYDESEVTYRKTIEIEKQLKDSSALAISYMDLANLYYIQYKDTKAIPLFKKALRLAQKIKDPTVMKTAYFNMAIVEENRNDYKTALQYFKKYSKIQDSLKDSQRIWELAEQQKKVELQQKNTEITTLEKNKQIQQAALQIKNQQRNLLLITAAGLLIIALLIARFYTNSLQKNKLIQAQKESLNELNKLKDELFSVLAHDLRSPVYHLIAVTNQMKTVLSTKNQHKLKELVLLGSNAANKTYLLLDNLLHWVLLQNKRMFFQKENSEVLALFDQVQPVFLSGLAMKHIQLVVDIPENLEVYADINSLKIIFRNLIDNAIKFTPEGKKIYVTAQKDNGHTTLMIKDTGVGMDEATVKSLRDVSIKTHRDTTGRRSTGLGLRLCFSFVKRNGGTLHIQSKKNKGTTTIITLPNCTSNHEKN